MNRALHVLILAGGGGTRLWPLSREGSPKPLLPLASGQSPLRRAVSLAGRIAGAGHVWVVAETSLARRVRAHLGSGQRVRYIIEPAPRNTAAAVALAAAVVQRRAGAKWVLCLPADQWIRRPAAFAVLVKGLIARGAGEWLITFGLRPAYATPGYGYIEMGKRVASGLRTARRFVEKPPAQRAARYVRSGQWVWNSGMFLWRPRTFLNEVERLLPEVAQSVSDLLAADSRRRRAGMRRWLALRSISVDHGILEQARGVAVAPCDPGWQDLGSWDAVAAVLPRASDGTRHQGQYLSVDGRNCVVYAPEHLVVNLGAHEVGLVVTRDAVLLFDPASHQRVREVVERLGRGARLRRFR